MRPSLIVFIDCFPARFADGFLPALRGRAGMHPGFGYSINIMSEMFAGKTPDDLGTFNIFNLNPRSTWLGGMGGFLPLLAPLGRVYAADRMAHRLLSRKVGYAGNIPFEYIRFFEPSAVYVLSQKFPHPSIFSDPRVRGSRIFHSDVKHLKAPHRDAELVARARKEIRAGESLFLSLSDLDWFVHGFGVGSPEFMQRIDELNTWLTDLVDRFLAVNPDGYVSVLSDHGAENTHATHDLRVEKHLGRGGPGRYLYFLDATLGRFWVPDPVLRGEAERFLSEDPHGRLVTEEERADYGLASRALGDFIYVVDEGYGISPSFLGRGLSKALHGYHPALESQRALFVSSDPVEKPVLRSLEVYRTLMEQMHLAPRPEGVPGAAG